MEEIAVAIRGHQHFLVATHIRPDGDAIGCLLAMTAMLRQQDKSADAYCQDGVPPGQQFLCGSESILHDVTQLGSYDVAILVDCGEVHRVGEALAARLGETPLLINIDHHLSSVPFGTVHWVDASASSTAELLYELFRHLSVPLDPSIATQLYTGILMDTGSFRFANTSKKALEYAAALVGAGADPAFIAQQVYDSASPNRLRLLTRVLSTLAFFADDRLATAVISQDMFRATRTTPADSEAFVNELRSVRSVEIAIIFREDSNGLVHASLRSKGDINVAAFAQRYGGGGHRQAAALRIPGDLEAVRAEITTEARRWLEG
jgi:phosphoesterase RecJ-like protein